MQEATPSPPLIHWRSLFFETLSFFKKADLTFASFLFIFFVMNIPDSSDIPDWQTLSPFSLWLLIAFGLLWLAISYLSSVVFFLWINDRRSGSKQPQIKTMLKSAWTLLVPLSILSIRGAFLFVFGLLLLIIPGLYYSFKYELASYSLIFEGWDDQHSPIARAERIISDYGLSLLPMAILMFVGWGGPWILEFLIKWMGTGSNLGIRLLLAGTEAGITAFFNIYCTLIYLTILNKSRMVDVTLQSH